MLIVLVLVLVLVQVEIQLFLSLVNGLIKVSDFGVAIGGVVAEAAGGVIGGAVGEAVGGAVVAVALGTGSEVVGAGSKVIGGGSEVIGAGSEVIGVVGGMSGGASRGVQSSSSRGFAKITIDKCLFDRVDLSKKDEEKE